jgi:uncharacterized BrkB/YihY/UPF0761 family membrane protein
VRQHRFPARPARIPLIIAAGVALAALAAMRRDRSRPRDGVGAHAPGRGPAAPARALPARGWKDTLVRVWKAIDEDRVLAVAAGVAFFGLLAIFPALASLVSLYGLFAEPAGITRTLDQLAGLLPGGAIEVIREQMTRIAAQPKGALGLGAVAALAISAVVILIGAEVNAESAGRRRAKGLTGGPRLRLD